MRYRDFIQDNFLIDRADTGELVPFVFNKVQNKYYDQLVKDYDIENKGIVSAVRENILKARREGFSSLVLALFCADDIRSENPTETCVLSYKDDATDTFKRRYRVYALSFFAYKKLGYTKEQIKQKPAILDMAAKKFFAVDSNNEVIFRHNNAHFYCGTASSKVGGRGGVLQKLLFSEIAYYPDTEKMTAKEIIEGTMRQVDISSGWIFCESTENGRGTYQHKMWQNAKMKLSRFLNRFYGAHELYTEEEIELIRSEFVDMDMFRREYPMTEDDLFASSILSFVTEDKLARLIENKTAKRQIVYWMFLTGTNYIDQCEILKSAIESVEKKYHRNSLYVGIDIAKQHDKTVLTILMDRNQSISGGVKCIAIDSTGAGDFMPDWFERNTRFYLERVKFSRMSKDIMYTNLNAVIEGQLTAIPQIIENSEYITDEAKLFWNEMIELQKKIVGEIIVVSHPNGDDSHDDFPDSWALAEHAFSVINGIDKRQAPAPSHTLPNAIEKMLLKKDNNIGKIIDTEYD